MFSDRTRWDRETNRFTRSLEAQRARGLTILDLTASNPTNVGLRYEEQAILEALADKASLVYEPDPRGLLSAREAVAGYYLDLGVSGLKEDSILLTSSTSEAYSYTFRLLCNPGDEILVGSPSYPLFEYLAQIQDVQLVSYELIYDHGWLIDFHSLRERVSARTRAIVLVNPNNPTGSYISDSEQAELNEIAREHELAIIVDEVFLDFQFDGKKRASFTSNSAALTFTLSGISKVCALPQMKLAWLVASGPEDLRQEALSRLEVIADTYLSPSAPIQNAAANFLSSRNSIQNQLLARMKNNLHALDSLLTSQKLCGRLQVQGGWYAVLRVPVTRSDEQFAVELLERHSVLVHPGHFFNFPTPGYFVLSLITPERDFREGVQRLLSFVHESEIMALPGAESGPR